jgi:hypothetical protein
MSNQLQVTGVASFKTNVGVGTTSPLTFLSIENSGVLNVVSPIITSQSTGTTYAGMYSIKDGAGDQRGLIFQNYTANVGLTEKVRITSIGSVGIGTSSPLSTYKMTIEGTGGGIAALADGAGDANIYSSSATIGYHLFGDQGGAAKVYILGNGDVKNANNSYGAISDVTLKENITDATPKLQDLLKVKIRNYNLIDDEAKTKQLGVIAQELEEVFPNLISEDKQMNSDKTIKTVKYSVFVPMLIKAIQEQQEQINQLRVLIENK